MGFNQNSTFGFGGSGSGGGGGGGTDQKQPLMYIVGTTAGAPTAGASTWVLPAFANSWVVLWLNNSIVNMIDAGDGSPYFTKPLAGSTLTLSNVGGGFNTGDILMFILITPTP